ncbi:MAG: class F sortase [Patescibacteria group bacterium]
MIVTPPPVKISDPVRLKIPSLKIDAAVEQVTVTAAGAMAVPTDPMITGWYQHGPRPGESGSATISGHVNWWSGVEGIFIDLHKLKIGETIVVQDDQGQDVTFAVRDIQKLDSNADTTAVFTSDDDRAHLNLITCSGAWDSAARQYTQRLVVFTDKVGE